MCQTIPKVILWWVQFSVRVFGSSRLSLSLYGYSVSGGGILLHAVQPGGPVAAEQQYGDHGVETGSGPHVCS